MVVVSVTRCWLTPPAAMVMDMVDTIGSLPRRWLYPETRVSLDLAAGRLDGFAPQVGTFARIGTVTCAQP